MRHIVQVTVVYDENNTGGGAVIHCTPELENNILTPVLQRMCDAGGVSYRGKLPDVHLLPPQEEQGPDADEQANYEEQK